MAKPKEQQQYASAIAVSASIQNHSQYAKQFIERVYVWKCVFVIRPLIDRK